MSDHEREIRFQPRLTGEEMVLILRALSAYQHNTRYRAVYQRLRQQAERLPHLRDAA